MIQLLRTQRYTGVCVLLLALAASVLRGGRAAGRGDLKNGKPGWELIWSDEFEYFDPTKWEHQYEDGCSLGICKWGNKERSWYTDKPSNVRVADGQLTLEAREEAGESKAHLIQQCWDRCGASCAGEWNVPPEHVPACVQDCGRDRCPSLKYSSSRIRTFGKFSISPNKKRQPRDVVKIEARIKLDCGDGMWPAFWLLPEEGATKDCSGCGKYGIWPRSGEIDIMEMFGGKDNTNIHGTVHYGDVGQWVHRTFSSELKAAVSKDWHTYGIEWSMETIKFTLDGKQYGQAIKATALSPGWWSAGNANGPFDTNFHLLLNLAAGGSYTNNTPDDAISRTIAEGRNTMTVDWVRVWGSAR
jgi:beta-glucanase (GH16 family)